MDAAFEALESADIALAPSADGGYALIGARREAVPHLPRLLEGMRWSSPRVFSETLERISAVGSLRYAQLPLEYDLDAPPDLRFMKAYLRGLALAGEPFPRRTYALLRRFSDEK